MSDKKKEAKELATTKHSAETKEVVEEIFKADPSLKSVGKKTVQRVVVAAQRTESFIAPIPPPHYMEHYNQIIDNGAERIMEMAEGQHKHQIGMEKKLSNWAIFQNIAGQGIATSFLVLFGAASFYFFYKENNTAGIALISVPVTGLIGKFLPHRGNKGGQ